MDANCYRLVKRLNLLRNKLKEIKGHPLYLPMKPRRSGCLRFSVFSRVD
jgi:hypothetical protein